jgi:hypothetical protein
VQFDHHSEDRHQRAERGRRGQPGLQPVLPFPHAQPPQGQHAASEGNNQLAAIRCNLGVDHQAIAGQHLWRERVVRSP